MERQEVKSKDSKCKLSLHQKFLEKTMNNIGHALIEEGIDKTLGQLKNNPELQVVLNWDRNPKRTNKLSKRKIFVTSSGLISQANRDFDEQGQVWNDLFEQNLTCGSSDLLICNLGVNGIPGQFSDETELAEESRKIVNIIASRGEVEVWVRGEATSTLLTSIPSSRKHVLGCPSFSLLGARVDWVKKLGDIKRVVLTGAAIGLSHELFPPDLYGELEFFVFPQSSGETVANPLEKRPIHVNKPRSANHWRRLMRATNPDLVIGTRLHSCILGLSLGFPSAIVSGDLRTKELADVISLPYFPNFDGFSLTLLKEKLNRYNTNVDGIFDVVLRQKLFIETWLTKSTMGGNE